MNHGLKPSIRRLSASAAIVVSAATIGAGAASAATVPLPPNPCVTSLVRCLLRGAPSPLAQSVPHKLVQPARREAVRRG